MTDQNPLLTTLYVTRSIGENQPTAEWLCRYYEISDRTLKRYLDEARHLGAQLVPVKMMDGRYHWTCENWNEIQQRGLLGRWIQIEEEREKLTALI